MTDPITDPAWRMQLVAQDDPEWAAVSAAYEVVDALMPHAQRDEHGRLAWRGFALRAAFVEGAKWQREQDAAEKGEAATTHNEQKGTPP